MFENNPEQLRTIENYFGRLLIMRHVFKAGISGVFNS